MGSKGCCDDSPAPSAKAKSSSKGCCDDSPALSAKAKSCSKGCCDDSSAPSAKAKSCSKGCCDDSPAPSAKAKSCSKGCCDDSPPSFTSNIADVTMTIADSGELTSCDLNLCCKAIQRVPGVSHVEHNGIKSFKVLYSPDTLDTVAQIKEAIEDMGFDVE